MTGMSGLLLFDKPSGWTSHDVVAVVRRVLARETKVGHTGTLDPLATGLLILLIGQATRQQQRLQGLDKVYTGSIRLGIRTDTGDISGRVLEERPVGPILLAECQRLMDEHVGLFEMPAPAYSAVKHEGRPLYKYARAGLEIPVKPRSCMIRQWRAISFESPELQHRLSCSSGTYVRSLAESLGRKLGCGATVSSLRRQSIESYSVDNALTMERFKTLSAQALQALLQPL